MNYCQKSIVLFGETLKGIILGENGRSSWEADNNECQKIIQKSK